MTTRFLLREFLVTRVLLFVLAYAAVVWIPPPAGSEIRNYTGKAYFDMWGRWDAPYYMKLAQRGYDWQQGLRGEDVAFYPAYPLTIGAVHSLWIKPSAEAIILIGLAISNACLFGAVYLLNRLMVDDGFDDGIIKTTRRLIWLAPASIFFSGVYTESLFLFLIILASYFQRRGNALLTGLAGVLAGLTRPAGVLLSLVLIFEMRQNRHIGLKYFFAACMPVVGFGVYVWAIGTALHEPLAYFNINTEAWGRTLTSPLAVIADYAKGDLSWFGWQRSIVDLLFTGVFAVLAIWAWKTRPAYGLLVLGIILLPALSGSLLSMPRYTAVAFPAYIALAARVNDTPWKQAVAYTASALLAVFFAARFVAGYWVA